MRVRITHLPMIVRAAGFERVAVAIIAAAELKLGGKHEQIIRIVHTDGRLRS